MIFDANLALDRISRHWQRLGSTLSARAVERAKIATDDIDARRALDLGAAAEACFWQATGDRDAIDLKKRTP